MPDYMKLFTDEMDRVGWHYNVLNEEDHLLSASFNCDNTSMTVYIDFDEDQEGTSMPTVHLTIPSLARIPDSAIDNVIFAVNECNKMFRWAKFFVNDNEVCADCDTVLDENGAGFQVVFLVDRLIGIADKAYPNIMKAIYA